MESNKDWMKDFESFMSTDPVDVPEELTHKISDQIHKKMNPSSFLVFSKILFIHIFIGSSSLSICHQFGMNPFNTSHSLSNWLMNVWGHSACMFFCGMFFLGMSVLLAGIFLSIEEVNALRKNGYLLMLTLGFTSLAGFTIFGAELILTFSALWLMGAFVGGFIATESVWWLKKMKMIIR